MIYDVSMTIHPDVQVYKNKVHKKPKFSYLIHKDPHFVSETEVTLNMHTGTHMDFPRHMIEHGDISNDFDATTFLNQPVKVFDMTHINECITGDDVDPLDIQPGDMVFFKTKNSLTDAFIFDFTYLDASAAKVLVKKGVLAVGVDGLGIERNDPNHHTHVTLMSHGIWIIEGLRLKDILPKRYTCIALPMPIEGADALPLRVLIYD
jgi:arylformamidase